MKPRFSLRAFLHTRLGALLWTLMVALLAFHLGQTTTVAQSQADRPARITT